jgi:hypothetical protein
MPSANQNHSVDSELCSGEKLKTSYKLILVFNSYTSYPPDLNSSPCFPSLLSCSITPLLSSRKNRPQKFQPAEKLSSPQIHPLILSTVSTPNSQKSPPPPPPPPSIPCLHCYICLSFPLILIKCATNTTWPRVHHHSYTQFQANFCQWKSETPHHKQSPLILLTP